MLSILISSEYFATKPDLIIDEFIGMFMAGMKTSQVTLTNLIQYLCLNPTVKTRLLAEITPVLHEIKHDIRNNLEWEKIKDFEFTRNCFYETLRIAPPAPMSGTLCFLKDTTIQNITFKAGMAFWLNFTAMHHWPSEWQSPDEFSPDRFDISHRLFLRPDNTKRNPLAFTPFLGGKRICLGKNFAETAVRTAIPLLLFHFDFEFANFD